MLYAFFIVLRIDLDFRSVSSITIDFIIIIISLFDLFPFFFI